METGNKVSKMRRASVAGQRKHLQYAATRYSLSNLGMR